MKAAKTTVGNSGRPLSTEATFAEIESALNRALSESKRAQAQLSAAIRTAKAGRVRRLQDLAEMAWSLLRGAAENAEMASNISRNALVARIQEPAYLEEVRLAANAMGLSNVTTGDGRILSRSVTAQLDPQQLLFSIGATRWDTLRPVSVARLLASKATQKSSAYMAALLEAIFEVHSLLTKGQHALAYPIDLLYKTMTALPLARRAYTLDDFHADIVDLDDNGPKTTKGGYRLEILRRCWRQSR